jgi:hypothetical protein
MEKFLSEDEVAVDREQPSKVLVLVTMLAVCWGIPRTMRR